MTKMSQTNIRANEISLTTLMFRMPHCRASGSSYREHFVHVNSPQFFYIFVLCIFNFKL